MLDFPATHRNRDAITDILRELFDSTQECRLLELASGSGQHVAHFASTFPSWTFQPSDLEQEHLRSIEAYRRWHELSNVSEPKQVDVLAEDWGLPGSYDGILAINLLHISPWACTSGLFCGARKYLKESGLLYLYGAYRIDAEHTSESNRAFDQSLRARNSSWGVRCLNEVSAVAQDLGFQLDRVVEMPANNLSVVFRWLGPSRGANRPPS